MKLRGEDLFIRIFFLRENMSVTLLYHAVPFTLFFWKQTLLIIIFLSTQTLLNYGGDCECKLDLVPQSNHDLRHEANSEKEVAPWQVHANMPWLEVAPCTHAWLERRTHGTERVTDPGAARRWIGPSGDMRRRRALAYPSCGSICLLWFAHLADRPASRATRPDAWRWLWVVVDESIVRSRSIFMSDSTWSLYGSD